MVQYYRGSFMSAHLEKVLKHAEAKLINLAQRSPTDLLDLYRNFLKVEEHRLRMAHRAGESGLGCSEKRADVVDVVLQHIFSTALTNAEKSHAVSADAVRIAMVATGGYGRGQLSPFSDIDLLFLYDKQSPKSPSGRFVTDTIEQVLYVLWDIGLKVGHASRDLEQAIQQGREDLQTRTALLESRLLTGNQLIFEEFQRRFKRICVSGNEHAYAKWRMEDQEVRHKKMGNTVFLQEPNVKSSCGGLRDYHNLLWMALAIKGIDSTQGLQEEGIISASDRKKLDRAYDFLLRVRNELHLIQGRAGDVLTLSLQKDVANALGYSNKKLLRRIEDMMRDYYQHSRDLYLIANAHSRRLAGLSETKRSAFWNLLPHGAKAQEKINGFVLADGELSAENRNIFADDPVRMVRVFQVMQKRNAVLSPELENIMRARLGVVTRKFLWLPEVREMLTDIMRQKGRVGRVVRKMHELGILGSLIPEFAPLTCLVQHEFYHRYTADEHTIVCIEQLDRVLQDEAEPYVKYRKIFLNCDKPEILYLALILHDVGKAGNTGDHSQLSTQLAVRFGRRMRIRGRELQNLSFLVDHHMTLTEFALRRNLEDPKTIRDFARIVQDKERLDLLMLMTFADVQGIGDSSWSNWKEGLVWTLYLSTMEVLEDEVEFLRKAEVARKDLKKRVVQHLSQEIDPGEYEAHFSALPSNYFSHTGEEQIVQDIKLVHEFFVKQLVAEGNPLIPVVRWEDRPLEDHSQVGIVTWDRDQLFTKIVGSFAVAGLNILSADIWTREDHIVIDAFRVCTNQMNAVTHKLDRQAFEKALARSLTDGEYDLERELSRIKSTNKLPVEEEVVALALGLDNESSEQYTLLHVKATDKIGILYRISKALTDNEISIVYARITTEKGAALDTFYLVDRAGKKMTDQTQQRRLLRSLNQVLQHKA